MAAASWSFDVAADRLDEMAGVRLDGETLRRHAESAAAGLARRRAESVPAGPSFAAAPGEAEFLTDGVFVPTLGGWRELKLGLFQKRERGAPADPADWASRELPAPTASFAFASLADCDAFSATWRGWAVGLGITDAADLTVLADGAAWIWNAAGREFPGSKGVLDLFHAGQHVWAAAKALHGEGTPAAEAWADRVRGALISDGWPGLCDALAGDLGCEPGGAGRAALDGLLAYFASHSQRLGYFGRLRTGRSIGSGAVEGLAKRTGRRLKSGGRGWREENVDPMAALVCAVQTPEWEALWALAS